MPFKSPFANIEIPQTDILSYIFRDDAVSDTPLWIDSTRPDKNVSSKQALQWIKRLGAGLSQLGIKRGDVILIFSPNHIFVPVAYLGIVGSGYIFSGANPAYTAQELARQLSDSSAKAMFAHPRLLDRVIEASTKVGLPKKLIFQFSDEINTTRDGIKDWTSILGSLEQANNWHWPVLNAEKSLQTVATINYSSGTTGLPKGVCVSHANLIANLEQICFVKQAALGYASAHCPQERWIGFLPLYHAYGQMYTILLALKTGIPVYIMTDFVFDKFLEAISRYKITHLQVAPPVMVMLVKRIATSEHDLSSIQDISCGAAPLSRQLQDEFHTKFGLHVNQGWGMTELTCTGIMSVTSTDDSRGSVGRLLPNSLVKLMDDDGREVKDDARGEIHIKGPNVFMGYWRNEKATRDAVEDGWLKTGDIGVRNSDGVFWIVDRKKELIKVNGLQVAPAELEAVLLENERIADAAVVGITINENEWPRAYVVLQPKFRGSYSPFDIQDWIASRVSKHKRLEGGVVLIDEVPKLASGKIQRKLMRDWAKRDAAELETTRFGTRITKL